MAHDDEARIADKVSSRASLRPTDRDIERHSRVHHGVMTTAQLERLGLSARTVRHRAIVGRLQRLGHGVYSIGHVTDEARWMAAVLGIGGSAVLSHRSAAALWGLRADHRTLVDVTLVGARTRRGPRGVIVHSGTALGSADVAVHDEIPCTTVARTLLDVAATIDRRGLERAIDRAEELRLFDLGAVSDVLARNRRRRGAGRLAAALTEYGGPLATRSEVEERLLALVRVASLPRPEVNAWIPLADGTGYSPDFLWRDARLIVEIDGRTHHARRRAFEHDRRRDRRLALTGYETRRYAASEILRQPRMVAREVAAFLAASS